MNHIERYRRIRSYTTELTAPLSIEDHLAQPIVDVSPPKWHLGHTTWFFETFLLEPHHPGYKVFDENFNFLFNSYYESVGERLLRDSRGLMTRPPLEKVLEYRQYVDRHMAEFLKSEKAQVLSDLIELGLQHEQQHQELFLTDFKYILSVQPFHPVYKEDFVEGRAYTQSPEWQHFKAGLYEIGHKGEGFCFDNEEARHKVYLEDFAISDIAVTNAEWLQFMADDGYENFEHWHSEGWAWVKQNQVKAPLYWTYTDGRWKRFSLSGLEEVKPKEAVSHISFYEAAAFAHWAGHRLPTEAEWEVAHERLQWGERWEWTNSAYLPYPGFKTAQGAVGEYNGKFMVNQMVLRGASVATSPEHSRPTYRNFFHPQLRWQFTGLRLVK